MKKQLLTLAVLALSSTINFSPAMAIMESGSVPDELMMIKKGTCTCPEASCGTDDNGDPIIYPASTDKRRTQQWCTDKSNRRQSTCKDSGGSAAACTWA